MNFSLALTYIFPKILIPHVFWEIGENVMKFVLNLSIKCITNILDCPTCFIEIWGLYNS